MFEFYYKYLPLIINKVNKKLQHLHSKPTLIMKQITYFFMKNFTKI